MRNRLLSASSDTRLSPVHPLKLAYFPFPEVSIRHSGLAVLLKLHPLRRAEGNNSMFCLGVGCRLSVGVVRHPCCPPAVISYSNSHHHRVSRRLVFVLLLRFLDGIQWRLASASGGMYTSNFCLLSRCQRALHTILDGRNIAPGASDAGLGFRNGLVLMEATDQATTFFPHRIIVSCSHFLPLGLILRLRTARKLVARYLYLCSYEWDQTEGRKI